MADKTKVKKGAAAIEEPEFNGYFNTKKEMIYKNIIWDLLNKSHNTKNKTQKQEKMKKEDKRKRLVSRTNHEEEDDNENKKKRRLSSKVNYDMLEKLMNDEMPTPESQMIGKGCKEEETVEKESYGDGDEVENGNENEEDEEVDYGNIYYGDEDEEEYNNEEDYEEDY